MTTEEMLIELKRERERLERVIRLLEPKPRKHRNIIEMPRRHLSAEARHKISLAQKRRWRAQKNAS